jgi:hypothetical protein
MKYPDTHFGHLSLDAFCLKAFYSSFSASRRLEVDEAITWKFLKGKIRKFVKKQNLKRFQKFID